MWSFILTILFSQTNARKEVILWKVYKLRTNRQTVAEYRVSEKVNEWAIQFNFTIMISSCLSPHWRTASVKHIRKYMYICVHLNLLAPYCQKNTMFSPRKRTVNPAVGAALALSQHAHDTLEIGTWSFPKLFDTIAISSNFMWLVVKIRTPTTMLLTEIVRSSLILWRYYRLKQLKGQYMEEDKFHS